MKNKIHYRIILIVFIVGCCFPYGIVSAKIEDTVLQNHISGWKLHHERLDIFRMAFSTRHDEREYVYCVEENPYIQGDILVKEWTFSWNDANYTMYENHTSFVMLTEGDNLMHKTIMYTIYTKELDSFVIEAQYISYPDGSDAQFLLMLHEEDSLLVQGIQRGERVSQTFALAAPYSLTMDAVYSVTDEQQLRWVEFNPETLSPDVKQANALRKGHLVIIRSQEEFGSEIIFNETRRIATRGRMFGVSVALCENAMDTPSMADSSSLSMEDRQERSEDNLYVLGQRRAKDRR